MSGPGNTLQIGIVGAGGMGTVHHSNYAHIEGCEVTALVGTSAKDEANAKEWGLPLYASISDMLDAHPDLDVVDVCTPTFLHKAHVCEALSNGKHVIVEKPIALKKNDAEAMYALAEQMGVQLFVAQVLQFTKPVETLRGLVRSGEYGKPLDASFTRLSACPLWAQGGWLFDKEKSGLLPFDLHIHDLDVIVSLFGAPQQFSFTSCKGAGKAYEEHYRFLYGYENLNVVAQAGWLNADIPFTANWQVYFENAMLVFDGEALTAYRFGHEPKVFDTSETLKIPTGINVPPTGIYHAELTHFLGCIRNGKPSNVVSAQQVINVVGLLEEITRGQ